MHLIWDVVHDAARPNRNGVVLIELRSRADWLLDRHGDGGSSSEFPQPSPNPSKSSEARKVIAAGQTHLWNLQSCPSLE